MEKEREAGSAFGALLRRYRLAAGLSQEDLAEQAQMSVRGIGALERGDRRYPYRDTVALLTEALGLTPIAAAELEAAAARPRQPHARVIAQTVAVAGSEPTTNLPLQRTSLIGRETEIADLVGLLADSRLVTVTGAGGVGKTRTALAVGERLLAHMKAGVWFVELAPIARGSLVAGALAQVLNLQESPNRPLVETLLAYLKEKSLLLILDNCEHVIDEAAALADALVLGCPNLRVLATSRASLRIAGERSYRLPSLGVPTVQESCALTAAETASLAAVKLFIERASAIDHRFTLSDDTAPIVVDVCRQLDGLPLAIELAAARVNVLGPRQLRERLKERFRVLTSGSRNALPRQQTIRATIDWSYDLLDERERTLFRRLGIFVNGFTLEGAVAAGSGDVLHEIDVFDVLHKLDVLDVLASLVDKSLVQAHFDGDAARYQMLESTRAYAAERLIEAGERDGIAGRHLRHLRDIFSRLKAEFKATLCIDSLHTTFEIELDDVRATLDGALIRADIIVGAELLIAIGLRWRDFGHQSEGKARIESFAAHLPEANPLVRAQLLGLYSVVLSEEGSGPSALAVAADALLAARQSGDGETLANALFCFAFASISFGDIDAAKMAINEAEAIPGTSAFVRNNLRSARQQLYERVGDFDAALSMLAQTRRLRVHSRTQAARMEAEFAMRIAEIEHKRGRTAAAIAIIREILPGLQHLPDIRFRAWVAAAMAEYLVAVNDLDAAVDTTRDAIAMLAQHEPDSSHLPYAIEQLALLCALRDELPRAAILAGYSDAALARAGATRNFADQTYDRLSTVLREKLARPDLERLLAEGAGLNPNVLIASALTVSVHEKSDTDERTSAADSC